MGDKEACYECKQKCLLIHGNNTDPAPLVTTFNKILFGSYDFSRELCLPKKISEAIPVLVAGVNHILQDTNGQRWEVKLDKTDGGLGFIEGWNKFYEDHGLSQGYVLTFHYIWNSHFVVDIFDHTGFEKLNFPVASGKTRKGSEIDGNCKAVGECHNLSSHSTQKQGAAFSGTYQHVASANCDTEQFHMIDRDDEYNYEEDTSLLLNLSNSEMQFRVHHDGSSDRRTCPSNYLSEFDAVAGNSNENTVYAKGVSEEPPAEVAASTLSDNITSKRARVAEADNDHHGDYPFPPIENWGQVHSENRIKTSTRSLKRAIEEVAGSKEHPNKLPKLNNSSGQTSGGVERNNEVPIVVKTEPVDSFNDDSLDASAFSFKTVVRSNKFLELPTSVTLWPSVKNKVVNLLGPDERVCPVLYHNNRGIKALTCNWINFFKSCRLRKGDECIFILEDEAETRFRIGVNRK